MGQYRPIKSVFFCWARQQAQRWIYRIDRWTWLTLMGEIARHRLLPATDGVRPLFPPLRGSFRNSPFILCAGPRRINAGGLKALCLKHSLVIVMESGAEVSKCERPPGEAASSLGAERLGVRGIGVAAQLAPMLRPRRSNAIQLLVITPYPSV